MFIGLYKENVSVCVPLDPLQVLFLLSVLPVPSNYQSSMENNEENTDINEIKSTLKDIKIHLHWVYEMVCTGVKENRVITSDVKYMANQMGCHESRIDDNDHDLRELMGIVDFIKEEVHKMANMNHCNHCQETPAQDHPVEETFVLRPVHVLEGKKKQ